MRHTMIPFSHHAPLGKSVATAVPPFPNCSVERFHVRRITQLFKAGVCWTRWRHPLRVPPSLTVSEGQPIFCRHDGVNTNNSNVGRRRELYRSRIGTDQQMRTTHESNGY